MSKHENIERFYVRDGEVYTYPLAEYRWADEIGQYLDECESRGMSRATALRMEVLA